MILGIDPGKKGALAFLMSGGGLEIADMPDSPTALAEKIRSQVLFSEAPISFAIIEDVGSMTYVDAQGRTRGQGAKASFSFGFDTGAIHGVLAAMRVRVFAVKPAVWKACYGLSADKNLSRELAIAKFPFHSQLFQRKKDDGRAEAALLALFGQTRFKK